MRHNKNSETKKTFYMYKNIKFCSLKNGNTVEPLLSGHPRGIGNWPLNRGWPLNKGSSGIKFWLRENVNLFKYKHALSFLTIVTCNTAITLSSKNHTNPSRISLKGLNKNDIKS